MTHIVYTDSGLVRRLTIYPQVPGKVQWQVGVGDGAIRSDSTALWTHYRPNPATELAPADRPRSNFSGYPWPLLGSRPDEQIVRDITRFAASMLWFLRDRHDLGLMLLHGEDEGSDIRVTRGEIVGSRWGEASAGLVQAVVLARAIPDRELERRALAKLARLGDEARGLRAERFRESVGDWAVRDSQWSPVDLSDLTALRRSPGPRR